MCRESQRLFFHDRSRMGWGIVLRKSSKLLNNKLVLAAPHFSLNFYLQDNQVAVTLGELDVLVVSSYATDAYPNHLTKRHFDQGIVGAVLVQCRIPNPVIRRPGASTGID